MNPLRQDTELLAGMSVLELSRTAAGAYAGRLLAQLGASVLRIGPEVDIDVAAEARPEVLSWLHEGKSLSPIPGTTVASGELLQGIHLVLAEKSAQPTHWQAFVDALLTAAAALPDPPPVVSIDGAVGVNGATPATALTISADSATSWSIGDAGEPPLQLPYDIPLFLGALHAASAGLISMLTQAPAGHAPHAAVAVRDVLTFQTGMITSNFIPYERPWRREGTRPPGSAGLYPVGIFECLDGHVVLLCRSQREWDNLVAAIGDTALANDARFRDPRVIARCHADEVDQVLLPWIAKHTSAELTAIGVSTGLPVAPVLDLQTALDEPQLAARDFIRASKRSTHSEAVRWPSVPWRVTTPKTAPDRDQRPWPLPHRRARHPAAPLAGLRVLDLSWVWSGPMTAAVLGNLGADVIKVEHRGRLDAGRSRGRALRNGQGIPGPEHEVTPYFNQMNFGKRSVAIDTKTPQGQDLVRQLATHCDVVIENQRPGALQRNSIGYEDLSRNNSSLIMVSLSMAGQQGPLREMKGYAATMAAMAGLESIVGYSPDRLVGTLAPAIGDPNASGHALVVLLAALRRRKLTGQGAWIDLSQIEALICTLGAAVIESEVLGVSRVPANTHAVWAPHGNYRCAGDDAWIALSVQDDAQWQTLCSIAASAGGPVASLGNLPLIERRNRSAQIEKELEAWTSTQPRDRLVAELNAANVPCSAVLSFEEMRDQSWLTERDLTVPVSHPYLGEIDLFVVPYRFEGISQTKTSAAPLLGAHTDEVLRELLLMGDRQLAELHRDDVLR